MGAKVRAVGGVEEDTDEDAEGDVVGYAARDAMVDVVMDAMAHTEEDKSASAAKDAEEGAPCNLVLTAE